MILGFIFFILIIIGIILFIIWLIKRVTHSGTEKLKTGNKAIEVLKERYAKGEITKEQYEDIKKDLIG